MEADSSAMMRQTQIGRWEMVGDPHWISPYHTVSIEYEAHDGTIRRKNVEGLRKSSKIISFRDKTIETPEFLK